MDQKSRTNVNTQPMTVLKSVGPKLVPFFKTVTIFFVLFESDTTNKVSIIYAIFKCLPIISLIIFVLLHGMNFTEVYSYSRRILIGLIFSLFGDVFMVYKDDGYFLPAVAAFAMAQLMYASAFGFKPINPYAGGVCLVLGILSYLLILPGIDGIMLGIVPVYCALIFIMAWRAIARVQLFDDLWTWTKLCGCAGAIFFLASDFVIAINRFRWAVPYHQQIIMTTYYAAQLGITLSVVDSHVDSVIDQSKKNK